MTQGAYPTRVIGVRAALMLHVGQQNVRFTFLRKVRVLFGCRVVVVITSKVSCHSSLQKTFGGLQQ